MNLRPCDGLFGSKDQRHPLLNVPGARQIEFDEAN
jgi:hypothetical protein